MLREIIVMVLMFLGAFFMLRMSSTAKAGTLGAGLILLGAAIHFDNFGIYTRAIAIIVFLLLTAPVAAHMIGRAAYFDGVPLWKGTMLDELRGHYRASTHSLETISVPEHDTPLSEGSPQVNDPEFDR